MDLDFQEVRVIFSTFVYMDPFLKKIISESGHCLRTLKSVEKDLDTENIHDFRLAIKQLNALVGFSGYPEKKDKHWPAYLFLKKCFNTAGVIRKAELHLEKLTGLESPFALKLLQKNQDRADKAKIKFMQMLQQADSADTLKFHAAIAFHLENLGSRNLLLKLNKHLNNEFRKLYKLANQGKLTRDMHDMRIIIRRLIELLNLIEPHEKNDAFNKLRILLKELNKKMGNWHDAASLIKIIKSYSKQHLPLPEDVQGVNRDLQSEMTHLENEIATLLERGPETTTFS